MDVKFCKGIDVNLTDALTSILTVYNSIIVEITSTDMKGIENCQFEQFLSKKTVINKM